MIEKAKQLRDSKGYTCVILNESDYTFTSYEKGVMPLYGLNKKGISLDKPIVLADKVIGKAAAILAIRLGITLIDTLIISKEGKNLLDIYNISYTYLQEVPRISNRLQTDQCPMEKALDGVTSIEEGWQILDTFIQNREKRGH